eukprot:3026951-Pleurochrysis_carterae.AAC.2
MSLARLPLAPFELDRAANAPACQGMAASFMPTQAAALSQPETTPTAPPAAALPIPSSLAHRPDA